MVCEHQGLVGDTLRFKRYPLQVSGVSGQPAISYQRFLGVLPGYGVSLREPVKFLCRCPERLDEGGDIEGSYRLPWLRNESEFVADRLVGNNQVSELPEILQACQYDLLRHFGYLLFPGYDALCSIRSMGIAPRSWPFGGA